MKDLHLKITGHQKIYFASDFHLGAPGLTSSREREKEIIRWLNKISQDAAHIFLVGDVFDFWFEYKKAIPKGFIRFLGKLAELQDQGIQIHLFTGNHDLWIGDYLVNQIGLKVYTKGLHILINDGQSKLFVAHGDGLGPGDHFYKFLKSIFTNRFCQFLFRWVHPDWGIALAHFWSRKSRLGHEKQDSSAFRGEEEWLIQFSRDTEKKIHHDYYIFGHRHLPVLYPLSEDSTYINLGEWLHFFTFASWDNGKINYFEWSKGSPKQLTQNDVAQLMEV